jgi:DNA invertase Pin-like site-specific DNA recombinase
MKGKFVSYLRVSTEKQGRSGLGLEAQRQAVASYLNGGDWELVGEYVEQESGGDSARPELARAVSAARRAKGTLIVAKLDRLARDAKFILGLVDAGVRLRFVDLPDLQVNSAADRFQLTILAAAAELERRLISERTKGALAAKKARGAQLGNRANLDPLNAGRAAKARAFAENLRALVVPMQKQGMSLQGMANELNKHGVKTPRKRRWTAMQVHRVLARLTEQAR